MVPLHRYPHRQALGKFAIMVCWNIILGGKATEILKSTFNSFTNLRQKLDTWAERSPSDSSACALLGWSCEPNWPIFCSELFALELMVFQTWHVQCDCASDQEKPGWQNRVLSEGKGTISAAELPLMPTTPPKAVRFLLWASWEVRSLQSEP